MIDSQLFTREFANSILLEEKSSLVYLPCTMKSWMTRDLTSFFNSVSVISGRCEGENERLNALEHDLQLGAWVAQWVKRWPTDLAVLSSIPTLGEIFSTVNGGSIAHSLSLSTSHRPDITEMLLKRT